MWDVIKSRYILMRLPEVLQMFNNVRIILIRQSNKLEDPLQTALQRQRMAIKNNNR